MQGTKLDNTDNFLFGGMQKGSHECLRQLFDRYYVGLCRYVNTLIENEAAAEDIVQGVFVYVWEHRSDIVITVSVRTYLFTSCRYKALNHLRYMRRFTRFEPELHDSVYEEMDIEKDDLHCLIEEAIMSLPDKCGRVFRLRNHEELSYKEIAEREGIAVKTVEAHLHTALKRLKEYLAKQLTSIFL